MQRTARTLSASAPAAAAGATAHHGVLPAPGALAPRQRRPPRRFDAVVEDVRECARAFRALDGPAVRYRVKLVPLHGEIGEAVAVFTDVGDVPKRPAPRAGEYVSALVDGAELVTATPLPTAVVRQHLASAAELRTLLQAFLESDTSQAMSITERAAALQWTQRFVAGTASTA